MFLDVSPVTVPAELRGTQVGNTNDLTLLRKPVLEQFYFKVPKCISARQPH
jgi:hypothetical protein